MKVIRYSPKIKGFYELIKLIPDKWKYKIETANTQTKAGSG